MEDLMTELRVEGIISRGVNEIGVWNRREQDGVLARPWISGGPGDRGAGLGAGGAGLGAGDAGLGAGDAGPSGCLGTIRDRSGEFDEVSRVLSHSSCGGTGNWIGGGRRSRRGGNCGTGTGGLGRGRQRGHGHDRKNGEGSNGDKSLFQHDFKNGLNLLHISTKT